MIESRVHQIKKEDIITIYDKILKEHQFLSKQIKSLQKQITVLPEGNFFCSRNQKRYKWYRSNGKTTKYLPKSQRHLAEQLALKKYLSLELQDAVREKEALDFYLQHHDSNCGKAKKLLTEIPEYQKLLNSHFIPQNQELNDWMNSPYKKSNKHPEQLTYNTGFGYSVRSKSELLIDYALHTNKIPFRYENPLELENIIIYPDFTIRHPATGEFFYWEHFGMLDDPAYLKNVFSKLNLYVINGIIPNINLITTYETKDCPLDNRQVSLMIQTFFE